MTASRARLQAAGDVLDIRRLFPGGQQRVVGLRARQLGGEGGGPGAAQPQARALRLH